MISPARLPFILFLLILGCGKPEDRSSKVIPAITTATIQLPTLKCKTCVATVERSLAKLEGLEKAEVHLEPRNLVVTFLPAKLSLANIEMTVSMAGYTANDVKRDSAAYEALPSCCK